MALSDRLALPGMNRRRAAVLPVGATILAATAAVLGVERYVVSEWGLREGAILNALGRRMTSDYFFFPSIRFILVPHTGHVPWAALRPFASSTSWPSN